MAKDKKVPSENDLSTEKDLTNEKPPETVTPEKTIENENENSNQSNITMDALTAGESFPEVKDNAIQAVLEQRQAEKTEADKLEAAGIKLNKDGSVSKKRGRKAGSEVKTGFINPDQNKPVETVSPSLQTGVVISGLLEQMTVTLISDDFILEPHEREANILAWVKTLDHYGGVEISPPMALALSHASIIMVRANKEKTRTKLGLAKAWFKNKIANFKGRKNALTNSGKNDVGQNDIRKEESAKS